MTLQSPDESVRDDWRLQWNLVGLTLAFFAASRIAAKVHSIGLHPLVGPLCEFVIWMLVVTAAVQTVFARHAPTRDQVPNMIKGFYPMAWGIGMMLVYGIILAIEIQMALP